MTKPVSRSVPASKTVPTLEDLWSAPQAPPAPKPAPRAKDPVQPLPAPHNGTVASREAAHLTATTGQSASRREQVLAIIRQAGERGITRSDISHEMARQGNPYPANLVAARCYELLGRQADKAGFYPEPVIEELDSKQNRTPDCGGAVKQGVVRVIGGTK